MEKCKICNESFDKNISVVLRAKGSDGVNRASAQRGSSIVTFPGDRVHIEYRCNYCKAENIVRANATPSLGQPVWHINLRSEQRFNIREHCLFCGQYVKTNKNKILRNKFDAYSVRTEDFQEKIVHICHLRNDKWSDAVFGRISAVNDLHAANAI